MVFGTDARYHRIDVSTNLTDWTPAHLLLPTNGAAQLTDTNAPSLTALFYRAVEVEPTTAILGLSRQSGPPGTRLEIAGQFFAAGKPKDNVVQFGGVDAPVWEASSTRLLVEVPLGASSGPVTVASAEGRVSSPQAFIVTEEVRGTFAPPEGVSRPEFEIVNAYGAATEFNGAMGAFTISVRADLPLVTIAAPKDSTRQTYWQAVTVSAQQTIVIDAASTAQALVFLTPPLTTQDPALARELLDIIRQDAKVRELATLIAQLYPRGGDPQTNAQFVATLQQAVVSVGQSAGLQSLRQRQRQIQLQATPQFDARPFPLDLDWLTVSSEVRRAVVDRHAGTPVDWWVVVNELDVAAAFPNGAEDFFLAQTQESRRLRTFPYRAEGFQTERKVKADLLTTLLNPQRALIDIQAERIAQALGKERSITFPANDALYLLRGLGPAIPLRSEDVLRDAAERDFVLSNSEGLRQQYLRAIAINLVAAARHFLDPYTDVPEDLEDLVNEPQHEVLVVALDVAERLISLTNFRSVEDLADATLELTERLLDVPFFRGLLIEQAIQQGAPRAADVLIKRYLRNRIPYLRSVLRGVALGQLLVDAAVTAPFVERLHGFGRVSPLESAFIIVGDPFKLEIVSITPPGGAAGDEIQIVIRKAAFDLLNSKHRVYLAGVEAQVTAAPPPVDGLQTLTARLPAELADVADGEHDLLVLAQARRGQGKFIVANRPTVVRMTPSEGYAAGGNFLGERFGGTTVTLVGGGFSPEDTFIFGGGVRVAETNKSGEPGNVVLRAPQGAQSGPIIIQRRVVSGGREEIREGRTPVLTILAPPVIEEMLPVQGAVGASVSFRVSNLGSGSDVSAVAVMFGSVASRVVNRLENYLSAVVPSDAGPTNDQPRSATVAVVTPAGAASRSFTVLPGRTAGGIIRVGVTVGGPSPISFGRALQLAGSLGSAQPTEVEQPFINGQVGIEFTDTIALEDVAGNLELNVDLPFDRITGRVRGTVRITGNHNSVDLEVRGGGACAVVVSGANNSVRILCEDYAGDGVCIDGGRFNGVDVTALRLTGNAAVLTGGATGNWAYVNTGARDLGGGGDLIPDSGGLNGVVLTGAATGNTVSGTVVVNRGDGVRLDGDGVQHNRIGVEASRNGANGVVVQGAATGNEITGTTDSNEKNGVVLVANASGLSPRATTLTVNCSTNKEYGVLISGVRDTQTVVRAYGRSNVRAGLRLESGTRGIRCEDASFTDSGVGIEADGAEVTGNFVAARVADCAFGARLVNVARNEFVLDARTCSVGVVVSGGANNQLNVAAMLNTFSSGLELRDGADRNRITGEFFGNHNHGIVLTAGARNNVLQQIRCRANGQHGVLIQGQGTSGNRIVRARIGLDPDPISGNGGDGVRIEGGASDNFIGTGFGRGQELAAVEIRNNAQAGIRITGAGTRNNYVFGCLITLGSERAQPAGIIVEDQAEDTYIGGGIGPEQNVISFNQEGIVAGGKARRVFVFGNRIEGHSRRGIGVDGASEVFIGSPAEGEGNEISFNTTVGVHLQGADTVNCRVLHNHIANQFDGVLIQNGSTMNRIGPGNLIEKSFGGAVTVRGASRNRIFQNTLRGSGLTGVYFADGAADNRVQQNSIAGFDVGAEVNGAATLRNTIQNNSITLNTGKGISLTQGGNAGIAPPRLTDVSSLAVFGTANAPSGSAVEVFLDFADEGFHLAGSAVVVNGEFRAATSLKPIALGWLFQVNGTVTDLQGNTSEFGPLVPPPVPSARIAFTSTRDGNPEIYLLDGLQPLPLRLTAHPSDDHSPALSADFQRVAYVSTRDDNAEIYAMAARANATDLIRLTSNAAADYDPAWSSDGRRIAFVSERDGNAEVYVMSASGTNVTRLTTSPGVDRSPSFSPDGSKIVIASNRSGNFEIYVMNTDGSNPQPLASHAASDTLPTWSPDGQLIAFVSERDGNSEIYTMRTDGSQITRLTNHPGIDTDPAWLGGGTGLVFASNRDEGFELYVMKASGGAVERLTVSAGNNTQPNAGKR